ncbi:MAG: non-homologous end-joining DNA ligase [Hyphomicrobiaceae bacterium]|nr:non-homologous end-joining DNA ligase [Hyphomicrobiaceae bacterium]
MAAAGKEIALEGVRLTSPDKVLYPEQGITKRALADYYCTVADLMLPHVARRPISLVRCPAGRQRKCFFQRHAGSGVPPEVSEIQIEGLEETGAYLFIRNVKGLIALVQMGVLEIHPWGSRIDRPDRPDRIVFDLDPGEGLAFRDVVAAAHELRAVLAGLDLVAFVRSTGGKGLHVVVPIERRYDWSAVKAFAKGTAQSMAADAPGRFVTKISKALRKGRIFIDYLRNDATATAIAPYSTRARAGAPVATPLHWDELGPGLDPAGFDIRTVPRRLARMASDPWSEIARIRQRLPTAASRR